jgi:hypothetical protein
MEENDRNAEEQRCWGYDVGEPNRQPFEREGSGREMD